MLLAAIALSGCARTSPPAPKPPLPADDPAAFNRLVNRCSAEAVADLIGKPVTPALLADARTRAHASHVRAIAPGDLVSMDYRGDRLNIETDEKRHVARVRCG